MTASAHRAHSRRAARPVRARPRCRGRHATIRHNASRLLTRIFTSSCRPALAACCVSSRVSALSLRSPTKLSSSSASKLTRNAPASRCPPGTSTASRSCRYGTCSNASLPATALQMPKSARVFPDDPQHVRTVLLFQFDRHFRERAPECRHVFRQKLHDRGQIRHHPHAPFRARRETRQLRAHLLDLADVAAHSAARSRRPASR